LSHKNRPISALGEVSERRPNRDLSDLSSLVHSSRRREKGLAAAPGFALYSYDLLRLIPVQKFESAFTAVSTKYDRYYVDDQFPIGRPGSPTCRSVRIDMSRDREDSRPMSVRVGHARAKMSKRLIAR